MHRRRRFFALGGLLSLVLVAIVLLSSGPLPIVVGAPPRQAGEAPPGVFDTDPLAGEELPLDGAITLYFDQPMDMTTVQAAFSIAPDVAGDLEVVDESTLRFTPSDPLQRATEYTITIDTTAESAAGEPLADPFALKLRTIGFLEVSQVLPAPDATGIATDATLTVIFNRPVVPLVSAEDMADLPDPLTIDPPVDGHGEWLNTSIYLFHPDGLNGGTTYTATIASGLTDVTGGVLAEDYTWQFDTLPPMILSVTPGNGESGVALDGGVEVDFNQPMDAASVEDAFTLVEQSAGNVAGSFDWTDDGSSFTFQPDAPLALNGFYSARVDAAAARAVGGAAALDASLVWNFTVVGRPRILRTDPANGDIAAEPYGGFSIYFATPMDRDSLADKVTIDPAPASEPDSYYYEYNDSFGLSFVLEPSTRYTITIAPGMADIYGNTIDSQTLITFSTRAYDPNINLTVPGNVGLYSAYAAQTRLFATHLNVSELDLALYRASLSDLAQTLGPNSYDFWDGYQPATVNLLRRWTLPVQSEENQRRYELLNISAVGGGTPVECPGAPEPRLEVGGTGIVLTDPDPLRVRASVPDGEIVDLLYKDYQFPVQAGPVCANGLLWWQIVLRDGTLGWVAEGDATEYYVDLLQTAPQGTPAASVLAGAVGGEGALPPGVYYLAMTSPTPGDPQSLTQRHMMVVATANLTFKFSKDSALVWVTDLQSGDPLPDTPVTIYDQGFNSVAEGVTDADGLLRVDIPRLEDLYGYLYAVVNSADAFGFATNTWTWGIEPYDFNLQADFYPLDVSVYLYSDRPIYRPGQPVYFRGVARSRDDVAYTPLGRASVPVRIEDNNGETVYEATLPLTEYGTFSGQFDLADDASLGYYRLVAVLEDNPDLSYSPRNFSLSFGVAEYRAPEFQVTVTPEATQVVQGDTIRLMVDSAYFFGGAVSNADVSYSVLGQDYFFQYSGRELYSFVDYNYDEGPRVTYGGGYGEVVAEGEGTTDAAGNFLIEVPADLGTSTQSQTYTIEARVTDESDQLVAGRADVIVHQGELYVGVRPERYVGQAGEDNVLDLIAVDWDSQPIAGQAVDVSVVERRWSSVQEEDEYGRTTWTWEVEEIPVEGGAGTVTTGADGTASFTFVPPTAGTYKATITSRDARGNEVRASTYVWVSGSEFVAWRQQNSNRIDLITDRDSYQVGDEAEILIASPWQGTATALITIERGDVLMHDVIALETNSTTYRFPIEDDFAPNVFVTVTLVKGVDDTTPVAEFRVGMAQLTVDPARREINVTVTPDRDQAGPRETVTYTVETTDYAGDPVSAEVGVGLTDLAVLSLADPNSQPLMSFFYGQQGLSVRTAIPLVVSVDQLTQTTLDTIKGGGGGGGEGGIFEVRQEFVDTPYWNPTIVTAPGWHGHLRRDPARQPDHLGAGCPRGHVRRVRHDPGRTDHDRSAEHQTAPGAARHAALLRGRGRADAGGGRQQQHRRDDERGRLLAGGGPDLQQPAGHHGRDRGRAAPALRVDGDGRGR